MFTNIGDIKLKYLHFDTSKNSEYQITASRRIHNMFRGNGAW